MSIISKLFGFRLRNFYPKEAETQTFLFSSGSEEGLKQGIFENVRLCPSNLLMAPNAVKRPQECLYKALI